MSSALLRHCTQHTSGTYESTPSPGSTVTALGSDHNATVETHHEGGIARIVTLYGLTPTMALRCSAAFERPFEVKEEWLSADVAWPIPFRAARSRWGFDDAVDEKGTFVEDSADPYLVMGLDRNASEEDIRVRWRYWSRLLHPDKLNARMGSGDGQPGSAPSRAVNTTFRALDSAHKILRDPERRWVFDEYGHRGLRWLSSAQHILNSGLHGEARKSAIREHFARCAQRQKEVRLSMGDYVLSSPFSSRAAITCVFDAVKCFDHSTGHVTWRPTLPQGTRWYDAAAVRGLLPPLGWHRNNFSHTLNWHVTEDLLVSVENSITHEGLNYDAHTELHCSRLLDNGFIRQLDMSCTTGSDEQSVSCTATRDLSADEKMQLQVGSSVDFLSSSASHGVWLKRQLGRGTDAHLGLRFSGLQWGTADEDGDTGEDAEDAFPTGVGVGLETRFSHKFNVKGATGRGGSRDSGGAGADGDSAQGGDASPTEDQNDHLSYVPLLTLLRIRLFSPMGGTSSDRPEDSSFLFWDVRCWQRMLRKAVQVFNNNVFHLMSMEARTDMHIGHMTALGRAVARLTPSLTLIAAPSLRLDFQTFEPTFESLQVGCTLALGGGNQLSCTASLGAPGATLQFLLRQPGTVWSVPVTLTNVGLGWTSLRIAYTSSVLPCLAFAAVRLFTTAVSDRMRETAILPTLSDEARTVYQEYLQALQEQEELRSAAVESACREAARTVGGLLILSATLFASEEDADVPSDASTIQSGIRTLLPSSIDAAIPLQSLVVDGRLQIRERKTQLKGLCRLSLQSGAERLTVCYLFNGTQYRRDFDMEEELLLPGVSLPQ